MVSNFMVSNLILMFNREVSHKNMSSKKKIHLLHLLLRKTLRQGRNNNNFNSKVLLFKRL